MTFGDLLVRTAGDQVLLLSTLRLGGSSQSPSGTLFLSQDRIREGHRKEQKGTDDVAGSGCGGPDSRTVALTIISPKVSP